MHSGGIHRSVKRLPARPVRAGRAALLRLLAAALAGLTAAGTQLSGGERPLGRPVRVGRIAAPAIRESSGIVAGRKRPGVYWTHNDSGGGSFLHAMDATGKPIAYVRVVGARNVDWEDIAADAGKLYIADVGDNSRKRPSITIYRLAEPDPRKDKRVKVEAAVQVTYPRGHGPQDCEAMFVRKGWAYLVSKELTRARLYRVKLAGDAPGPRQAEFVGALPGAAWITAADISSDGRHLALLSYTAVCVYDLPAPLGAQTASGPATTKPLQLITGRPRKRLVSLRQAEAICWMPGAAAADLLITNEQRDVYRVRPAGAAASQPDN